MLKTVPGSGAVAIVGLSGTKGIDIRDWLHHLALEFSGLDLAIVITWL